jgi:hypothetical protein
MGFPFVVVHSITREWNTRKLRHGFCARHDGVSLFA